MFQTGDFIIYGTTGVCEVEEVGTLNATGIEKGRIYYTLKPCYNVGSKVFTPADNAKVLMRRVYSKEEAMELINAMDDIDSLWVPDEKNREKEYREAFRKCDGRELVKIIKAIYQRKQERLAEGKKVTASDEKYFHLAEDGLYGELAISLGMEREEAKRYIVEKVNS